MGIKAFPEVKLVKHQGTLVQLLVLLTQSVRNEINMALSCMLSNVDMWIEITTNDQADWLLPLLLQETNTTQGSFSFTKVLVI